MTRLLIMGIFASLVLFPSIEIGGFIVQTIEPALFLGVLSALVFFRTRFLHAVFRDYFSLGLLLFTVAALLLMSRDLADIRDLNHSRYHSALPLAAYAYFHAISSRKTTRLTVYIIMSVAMIVGLLLNFLVLVRPDLALWSSFVALGKGFADANGFGAMKEGGRVGGLIGGDPIFTGAFCAICSLNGLSLFSLSRAPLTRVIGAILIVLGVTFLMYTQTRMLIILTCVLFAGGIGVCYPMFRTLRQRGNFILIACLSPLVVTAIWAVFSIRHSSLDEEAMRFDIWKSSGDMVFSTWDSFLMGTGVHRFLDEKGYWHSHNVWIFTAVVYGCPMAVVFFGLYFRKLWEIWTQYRRRKTSAKTGSAPPDVDDVIIYSTLLVFVLLLLESLIENTFFYTPRVSVFLYALLGMSKAASESADPLESLPRTRAMTGRDVPVPGESPRGSKVSMVRRTGMAKAAGSGRDAAR